MSRKKKQDDEAPEPDTTGSGDVVETTEGDEVQGQPALDFAAPGEYLEALGLKPEHVLSTRVTQDEALRPVLVVVTNGGRKLYFPGDEAKAIALSPMEKGEAVPAPANHGRLGLEKAR